MLDSKAGLAGAQLILGHEEETESGRHSQSGVGRGCSLWAGTQDRLTRARAGRAERNCDSKRENQKVTSQMGSELERNQSSEEQKREGSGEE